MRLYVVQHGDSLSKDVDPARPLSQQGRTDVSRLAQRLSDAGVQVDRVLHSGKRRAEETATILGEALSPEGGVDVVAGIKPLDPAEGFAQQLAGWTDNVMLATHLPFASRLASLLLAGTEDPIVRFVPGTAVVLERDAEGVWSLLAVFPPKLV